MIQKACRVAANIVLPTSLPDGTLRRLLTGPRSDDGGGGSAASSPSGAAAAVIAVRRRTPTAARRRCAGDAAAAGHSTWAVRVSIAADVVVILATLVLHAGRSPSFAWRRTPPHSAYG
jgi:hypothetical protein